MPSGHYGNPHASNTDMFARVMRLVSAWETSDFYLPLSAAHPGNFEAADSVPTSTVSSRPPERGASARAGEHTAGSGGASSSSPLDIRPRIGEGEDATSAVRLLAIIRDHGLGSSRGTKRTRSSSVDEA